MSSPMLRVEVKVGVAAIKEASAPVHSPGIALAAMLPDGDIPPHFRAIGAAGA